MKFWFALTLFSRSQKTPILPVNDSSQGCVLDIIIHFRREILKVFNSWCRQSDSVIYQVHNIFAPFLHKIYMKGPPVVPLYAGVRQTQTCSHSNPLARDHPSLLRYGF